MLDCSEAERWLRQASYTLKSILVDVDAGFYSWACFKAHQAAELALKAILRAVGLESFGHDLLALWRKARQVCNELDQLYDCILLLNKMYIPPRYPDAWPAETAPYENYSKRDAEEAYECANTVYRVVEECVGSACKDST